MTSNRRGFTWTVDLGWTEIQALKRTLRMMDKSLSIPLRLEDDCIFTEDGKCLLADLQCLRDLLEGILDE